GAVVRRGGQRNLELARQERKFRVERQVLAQQLSPQPRILDLARRDASPLVGGDVAHAIAAGLHAMQTSGNCVRNITTDQWAGVAPGEIEDPRLWAELLRQHLTLHPEFSFLPRKFKIALTASAHDRA